MAQGSRRPRLLSVIVPAYNEEKTLAPFVERLTAVLGALDCDTEVVFVDDGSTDRTAEILAEIREKDDTTAVVGLSRNFGKEIALTAGLDHAKGDAIVVIDADLQDPPELIPDLLEAYGEGADMVYAQRIRRAGESWLKKASAGLFYRLMEHLGPISMPRNTGDFRLMSREAALAVCQMREQHRFMKGLFAWVGFGQKAVPFDREARVAGDTKWSYWKLWNLSLEGITSFTFTPLRMSTYLGLGTALFSFLVAAWFIFRTLIYGDPVRGFPTLIVTILFLGGVQLTVLGIMGEYLGRIFNETKRRPLYFTQAYSESRHSGPTVLETLGEAGAPRGK